MTENFVASNGVRIGKYGSIMNTPGVYVHPMEEVYEARKEFFQKERDTELGRWRRPEDTDYVVQEDDGMAHVYNERSGSFATWSKEEAGGLVGGFGRETAREYFAAHPEPKPWHDAKEGEVWIIRLSRGQEAGEVFEAPAIFQAGRFRDHGGSWEAREVVDARRIYPESGK